MISQEKKIKYASALILAVMLIGWGVYNLIRESRAGSKTITVEVTDDAEIKRTYTLKTDAEVLLNALDELRRKGQLTYDGVMTEDGPVITAINGIAAEEPACWALYVNGQPGEYALDKQTVKDGDLFSYIYESN